MTITDIAWRGPRPLLQEDDLVGRDDDLAAVLTNLRSMHIIEITAASGVGKSSFVAAGLMRKLTERGPAQPVYMPVPKWVETLRALDAASVPAAMRGRKLYELALAEVGVTNYFDVRDTESEYPPVVVFDQFEECIRFNATLAADLMRFIAAWAVRSGVRHVVAARSEYKQALRPLEMNENAALYHHNLPEIEKEDDLRAIIETPVLNAKGMTIDPKATTQLITWLQQARLDRDLAGQVGYVDPGSSVGLLHLQALLLILRDRLAARPGASPTHIDFADLAPFADLVAKRNSAAALFVSALTHYVRNTLEEHLDPTRWWVLEATDDSMPPSPDIRRRVMAWSSGPQQLIAQVARFFSTSGYKVPQSYRTLLSLAVASGSSNRLSRDIMKSTSSDPSEIVAAAGWEPNRAGIAWNWSAPQVGETIAWTLREALDRMTRPEVNILRSFRGEQDAIYELVHDGLGTALRQWAEGSLDDPEIGILDRPETIFTTLDGLTGSAILNDLSPEHMIEDGRLKSGWDANVRLLADVDPQTEPSVALEHIWWIGDNLIGRTLSGLAFADSNFTGTAIIGSTFRNLRFERCDLRGVFMRATTLDRVEFVGGGSDVERIDTLTITGTTHGDVTFTDYPRTQGLFLMELSGGTWRFQNCTMTHLALSGVSGGNPVRFEFENCDIAQLSISETLSNAIVQVDEASVFRHVINNAGLASIVDSA